MQYSTRWRCLAPILVGLQLAACQQKPEPPPAFNQNRTENTGQALHRVRLTAKRAEELGIQTAPVREEKISGELRKVIPAAAVVHDQEGNAWAFKSPDSLVFMRERIRVERLESDVAILSEGPAGGTAVVTAGAAELFASASNKGSEETFANRTVEGTERGPSAGAATMLENGNIKAVYKTIGKSGLTASIVIEYKPEDEEYQKILDQVGGLKAGETKHLPPLPGR